MTNTLIVFLKGFSVEGQENIQEILSKQLYLCQFLCALSILRQGEMWMVASFSITFSVWLVFCKFTIFTTDYFLCLKKLFTSN